MDDRNFYDEREETRNLNLLCPSCKQETAYPIRWKVRSKKSAVPRGANEEDKKRFAAARSYMVRIDDLVACRKCRKRIEITGQSVVLTETSGLPQGDFDPENFGNR